MIMGNLHYTTSIMVRSVLLIDFIVAIKQQRIILGETKFEMFIKNGGHHILYTLQKKKNVKPSMPYI